MNQIYVKFVGNLFITLNFYVFLTAKKCRQLFLRLLKITFIILSLITETAGEKRRVFCSLCRIVS